MTRGTRPQSHTFPWLFSFSSGDCTAVSEPFCQSRTAESPHSGTGWNYLHSFIQYCTYWPIASHSTKCCDDAPKSVTQWHLYMYICNYVHTRILYRATKKKPSLTSCKSFEIVIQLCNTRGGKSNVLARFLWIAKSKGFLCFPIGFFFYLNYTWTW